MKLPYATASVLSAILAVPLVSGFAPTSHFVMGGSTLTPSVSPELEFIRAVDAVILEGQKKKKKKNKSKKKDKEPMASPYTVAQGTSTKKKKMDVVQASVAAVPTKEKPELLDAMEEATVTEPVMTVSKAESEAEREEREARKAASKSRQEVISRSLLQARLVRETKEREQALAMQARLRTEADALGLMKNRFAQEAAQRLQAAQRKQVATNRALFETRLVLEANSKAYKAKIQKEVNQRAILVNRLEREEQIREAVRVKRERIAARKAAIMEARSQPKAPEVEKTLKETYAAIDDLGERAFQMLVDLGLVEPSPDPLDPEYDDSGDNELVYDFAY